MSMGKKGNDEPKKKGMALDGDALCDVAGGVVRIWYEDPTGKTHFRDIISDADKDFVSAIDDDPTFKIVRRELC